MKILFSLSLLLTASLLAATDNQVLQNIDNFRLPSKEGVSFDMLITDKEGKAELKIWIKKNEPSTALSVYKSPKNLKGRAVLASGNVFYLFDPGMASPLRISPRQMLFGHAGAGDLLRLQFSQSYEVKANNEAPEGRVLELKGIPNSGASYDTIFLSFDPKTFRPFKAECKGASGETIKILTYKKLIDLTTAKFVSEYEILDTASNEITYVEMKNILFESRPAADFTVKALTSIK